MSARWKNVEEKDNAELTASSRQYDPAPSPNTTTGTPRGTPVPPYKGPSISTFLKPFGKLDLLAYMNKSVPWPWVPTFTFVHISAED